MHEDGKHGNGDTLRQWKVRVFLSWIVAMPPCDAPAYSCSAAQFFKNSKCNRCICCSDRHQTVGVRASSYWTFIISYKTADMALRKWSDGCWMVLEFSYTKSASSPEYLHSLMKHETQEQQEQQSSSDGDCSTTEKQQQVEESLKASCTLFSPAYGTVHIMFLQPRPSSILRMCIDGIFKLPANSSTCWITVHVFTVVADWFVLLYTFLFLLHLQ